MVGGIVVQIVRSVDASFAEVLDVTYFSRCWRKMERSANICAGDTLWWQGRIGFVSRDAIEGGRVDMNIGKCDPSARPNRAIMEDRARWGSVGSDR